MKRFVLALVLVCFASVAHAEEVIKRFISDTTVYNDGSIMVTEKITVMAENINIKRGIYRDFPTQYKNRYGGMMHVGFDVQSVTRDGNPIAYETQKLMNGVRVYLGTPNMPVLSRGEHTFTLTYTSTRQLGFFKDYDELYWNVTGNGWNFPIEFAQSTVYIPKLAIITNYAAYTGSQGAQGKDYMVANKTRDKIVFATTRKLWPGEGLTVAVAWPKGIVREPTPQQQAKSFLHDNGPFIGITGFLLVLLMYYLSAWHKVGRDPEKGIVIPLYEPPENMSPALVQYIHDMGLDGGRAFTASLINMAVKGFLTIEQHDKTYDVARITQDESRLATEEKLLADKLFTKLEAITLGVHTPRAEEAFKHYVRSFDSAYGSVYFMTNSASRVSGIVLSLVALVAYMVVTGNGQGIFMTLWLMLWSLGVFALGASVIGVWKGTSASTFKRVIKVIPATVFFLPFLGAQTVGIAVLFQSLTFPVACVVMLFIAINALFFYLLLAPTVTGRKIMDKIEGFKMYLNTAEQHRLDMLNPPDMTAEIFEKYLPYAIALGVENKWGEYFKNSVSESTYEAYQPRWYAGTNINAFSAGTFASSIGNSLSSAVLSSSSAPGSSSGSFGGGSSGGGGGGGGGGGF